VTLEVDGREHALPLGDLDRANLEIDAAELLTKGRKGQGK